MCYCGQGAWVFFFVDNVGRPLRWRTLVKVLALVKTGMNKCSFNTHSFRFGISAHKIRMTGRWSSDAYLKYIEPSIINLPS